MIDAGRLAVLDEDFDDVKTPGKLPGSEALEPGVGAALDETLLFAGHGIERADFRIRSAGFDFDEKQ